MLVLLASLLLAVPAADHPAAPAHQRDDAAARDPRWLYVALFLATVYGGYFGGALGVILVGVLGVALHRLKLANALKSALVGGHRHRSRVVVFGIFGDVALGRRRRRRAGQPARRLPRRPHRHPHPATPLRVLIVVFGVAVSVYLFVRV